MSNLKVGDTVRILPHPSIPDLSGQIGNIIEILTVNYKSWYEVRFPWHPDLWGFAHDELEMLNAKEEEKK